MLWWSGITRNLRFEIFETADGMAALPQEHVTLVVSAGAGGRTSIFDAEPEEFQRIMDHTLRPAFLAVRYSTPHRAINCAA